MDAEFRAELTNLLPRLRRFALSLTCDRDQADDLVQKGCLRALTQAHQWQAGTRLDSWMYRILQNLWIDDHRQRRQTVESLDDERHADVADPADFENDTLTRLTLEQVLRAMQKLSADARQLLALVSIEGLSYREAADVLQIPIGTVMSRLARARMQLRRQLGEES